MVVSLHIALSLIGFCLGYIILDEGDSLKMIEVDIIKGLEELKKNTTGEALELFDRHMWENLKCVP